MRDTSIYVSSYKCVLDLNWILWRLGSKTSYQGPYCLTSNYASSQHWREKVKLGYVWRSGAKEVKNTIGENA